MLNVVQASTEAQIEETRLLFQEYAASLGFDLAFQGFAEELSTLPGRYSPPSGRLLLAVWGGSDAGCVALRPVDETTCEMKRLFVRPEFRGKGIGRSLAMSVISEARVVGYSRMLLDTVPAFAEAIRLYQALGFLEIPPYRYNPVEGATFWALDLTSRPGLGEPSPSSGKLQR